MPGLSAEKLLKQIRENAEAYSRKATQLSNLLERAENVLRGLPGKFAVAITEGNERLEFDRNHDDWRLYYFADSGSDGDWTLVTESSVDVKSRAAILLPLLVDKMLIEHKSRLTKVEEGLKHLKKVAFLNDSDELEGK